MKSNHFSSKSGLVLLALGSWPSFGLAYEQAQVPLRGASKMQHHGTDPKIMEALRMFPDPVDAYIAIRPEAATTLAEPRLLRQAGDGEARWMTEGDKLRLGRQGKKFTDLTNHHQFLDGEVNIKAGKAHLPEITEQTRVREAFSKVVPKNMEDNLAHFSSYYTRHYQSETGAESARWLHGEVAKIIATAPSATHISLEKFTHQGYGQFSIIARFETSARNFSQPLTIVGAHQDSINHESPLAPAPGADDDGSGTVTILEAFRVLTESAFVPADGPVEFHWYAAEECGGCGSLDVARYKRESGAAIGAMLQLDMTGYIGRNATEAISVVSSDGDETLSKWVASLGEAYSSLPIKRHELNKGMGSDHESFTAFGYPATLGIEGNPVADGREFGDICPLIHTVNDTMYLDEESGYFSVEHMARFSELALAFVIEQAKWDANV